MDLEGVKFMKLHRMRRARANRRKTAPWLIGLSCVALFAAGAEAKTELTMWTGSLTPAFNTWVVDEFPKIVAQTYPDIELTVTNIGSRADLQDKRVAAAAAGAGPDIFHESGSFGLDLARSGAALPLDTLDAGWSGLSDLVTTGEWQYKGHLYAIPYLLVVTGFAYWQDMLDDGGVSAPANWRELSSTARKLNLFDASGKLSRGGLQEWNDPTYLGIYPLQLFTEQLGSSLYSKDYSKPNLLTPEAAQALDFAKEMHDDAFPGGAAPPSFAGRKTAMAFWFGSSHTSSVTSAFPDRETRDLLHLGKIPGPNGQNPMTIFNTWGWAVGSGTKHPQEAMKVIELFLSPEVQAQYVGLVSQGGLLSPSKSFNYPPNVPYIDQFKAMTVPPMTTWGPAHPLFNDVIRVAGPVIYKAITGETAPGNTLQETNRLLTSLFAEKGL